MMYATHDYARIPNVYRHTHTHTSGPTIRNSISILRESNYIIHHRGIIPVCNAAIISIGRLPFMDVPRLTDATFVAS